MGSRIEKNFSAGFSIAELIVSVAILGLLAGGVAGSLVYFQRADEDAGLRSRASLLAEQGLDAVRNVRDASYAGLTDGSFGLTVSSGSFTLGAAPDIQNGFSRTITISTVATNQRQVTSTVAWTHRGQAKSVALSGYLTNWQRVVSGIDWANPNTLAGSLNLSGNTDGFEVAISGNYAYVVRNTTSSNFVVVDISSPASPTLIATLSVTGTPSDVKVSGNYAYVTSDANAAELQVVNITTPATPSLVASLDISGNSNASAVFVSGTRAYVTRVTGAGSEFSSINISNPLSPTVLGNLAGGQSFLDVVVSGNYAYCAGASNQPEVRVIDITNPAAMSIVGTLDLTGSSNGTSIALLGTTLAVGRANGDLVTVSVATPTSPTLLATLTGLTSVNDIFLGYNNYLFVATGLASQELLIYDISSPSSPVLIGGFNSVASLLGVAYDTARDTAVAVGTSDTQEVIVVQP